MNDRGSITKSYTVWCNSCFNFTEVGEANNIQDVTKIIKRLEWSKIKLHWYCPECAKKKQHER